MISDEIKATLKVFKVSICDYVIARSAEEALEFRDQTSHLRPEELLDQAVVTPMTKEVYFPLPEEIEEEESRNNREGDNYLPPVYDISPPRLMKELVDEHLSEGFNVPAFIYCDRHWIHEYEIPEE